MLIASTQTVLLLLFSAYTAISSQSSSCPRNETLTFVPRSVDVYDVILSNCSITVYWTLYPMCSTSLIRRYVVQFAQGCQSNWNNKTSESDDTFLVIENQSIFLACLLGDCYVRVIAELFDADAVPLNITSTCVRIGESFHDPTSRKCMFTLINMYMHGTN